MNLDECKPYIKRCLPKKALIDSLIKMSQIKEDTINQTILNQANISAYIPMAYDSLRQILEAICIKNGYKVLNHVCLETLLESIYNISLTRFDRFRYIRNRINYYGDTIDLNQGLDIIKQIIELKKDCLNKYL